MPRRLPAPTREQAVARFEELYDASYRDVLAYLLRRTQQPDQAADLVADVFTAVWRRIGDVPPGDQARPWVFGVARHVLANHRRGARRVNALSARLRSELRETTVVHPGLGEIGEIGAVFRSLSDQDQEILALAGWEELDAGQIAVALGCARGTARVRLHRARNRFARALRRAGLEIDGGPAPSAATRRTTTVRGATS